MEDINVHPGTLSDLVADPANANVGTERGTQMLEDSLQAYGAGRSILVDRHGVIVSGNKTGQKAGEIGMEDVIVVHTDGTRLVVVQRDDLDMNSEDDTRARMLAVADNAIGEANLEWSPEVLRTMAEDEHIDAESLFTRREWSRLMESVKHAATDPDVGSGGDGALSPAAMRDGLVIVLNNDVLDYWAAHYRKDGRCVICDGTAFFDDANGDLRHCLCAEGQTRRITDDAEGSTLDEDDEGAIDTQEDATDAHDPDTGDHEGDDDAA